MSEKQTEIQANVDRWVKALYNVDHLKTRLRSAELELRSAMDALGESVMPPDASENEVVCVWVLDLIDFESTHDDEAKALRVRKHGNRYDMGWAKPKRRK